MFVDSHCHLDHLDLGPYNQNLDLALQAARDLGVEGFLLIGIDFDRFERLLQIEADNTDVWLSIGRHPLADEDSLDSAKLTNMASHPRVIAIGETGLDYHYAPDKKEFQKQCFTEHLEISSQENKPVIIHSRSAVSDTLALMNEYRDRVTGVLHCFTESWEMAKSALDMGYYISFSGIVTFRNAGSLREVARKIPADRLLIETDSPWLAPVPYRGKKNEPKYLPEVARCIADLRNTSVEQIGELTTQNFYRLFNCQT